MPTKLKNEKEQSPLLEEEREIVPDPTYTDKEVRYLAGLRKRLEQARDQRDQQHDEFDGMDYLTHYEYNERIANTYIQPKQNKEDTNFVSGTVRQKLFAVLSSLVNLDLAGDIQAFDDDGLQVQSLGDAMEDVILKTEELDDDDEKKYLRQYELLKHGTVFIEELWDEKTMRDKNLRGKRFKGKIDTEWTERVRRAESKPTRNIIPGVNVYLGDITKYNIGEQPFIYTVDQKPYEEAERMFGTWDRWDNVPKTKTEFDSKEQQAAFNSNWRLIETQQDQCEIIRYQDKWNNEFAVIVNGVLMTPVGLPLPWGYDDYNIAQQNLEPIHAKFAYGNSLVRRTRNKVGLLDEFWRLAIGKTQQSFKPPMVNISGRVLSNRVLMPGKITYGVQPNTLLPISDKLAEGVTNSEMAMIQAIQESLDSETVSPTFQGQRQGGDPTATEIIELQRQAKMMLGLTVFAMSMLEWKLEWLRLKNILAHWFEPEDTVVDEAREVLRNKYRQVSVSRPMEGGMGRRIVVQSENMPSSEAIRRAEDGLEREQGQPVRLLFINPKAIKRAKYIWQIVIKPREKRTTEVNKLMFRAFMQDAQLFGPMLNMDNLAEEFANVWEKNPQKLFRKQDEVAQEQAVAAGQPGAPPTAGGAPNGGRLSPSVNLPSPEQSASRQVRQTLNA